MTFTTMIKDEITGFWCWAVASTIILGDIKSSGYPVHLYKPKNLGINPNVNISPEKYMEKREAWDDEFNSSRFYTQNTGEINNIVIFISFDCCQPFESMVLRFYSV